MGAAWGGKIDSLKNGISRGWEGGIVNKEGKGIRIKILCMGKQWQRAMMK